MKIHEIQRQLDSQRSMLSSFPSQGSSFEPMYVGENQRAIIEVQIENAKMLAEQQRKLDRVNEALLFLAEHAKQSQVSLQARECIEDTRYAENLRLTRIAAWTGLIGVILATIGVGLQIAIR